MVGVGLLTKRPLKYCACHQKTTSEKLWVFAGERRGFENDMPQPPRLATKNSMGKNRGFASTRRYKVQNYCAWQQKKRPKSQPEPQQQKNTPRNGIVSLKPNEHLLEKYLEVGRTIVRTSFDLGNHYQTQALIQLNLDSRFDLKPLDLGT